MQHLSSYGIEDPTVEKTFISALLHNNKLMGKVGMTMPLESMVEPDCQAMFLALLSLYSNGVEFEEIAIRNELVKLDQYDMAGGEEGVGSFYLRPGGADPIVLSKIVLDSHSRRKEIELADLIQARAYNRGGGDDNDMAARLSYIQTSLQELQRLSFEDERALPSAEFGEYYESLMNNRETTVGEPKMCFKWKDLNRLSPSFVPGDMLILVAESGAGKTSFMADQAEFLWEAGYHGVFYHLELSTDKMADRRMARATGIPLRILQDGRLSGDGSYMYLKGDERVHVARSIALQAGWPGSLTLKHCPGWTMAQLCSDIRQRADAGQLDFIMVDYFNKLRVPNRSSSYTSYELGMSIELLKATLEDLWLVGWMAAQFAKVSKNKRKYRTVADARDTGQLDDFSNIGMVLDRPIDEQTGRREDEASVYITKCNAGEEGMVSLLFDGPRFRFRNMTHREIDLEQEFPDFA